MIVSTVIVSFNVKELLKDCLNSTISSLKGIDGELFVVDNNSHDATARFVGENFPDVKLIANKKNVGFSKANNQALKIAKGKYFLILNPDTKLEKDTVSQMLEFMESHKDVAVATCRVELANGMLDRDCRRLFPTPWRAFCHFTKLSQIFKGSNFFDSYYMGYLPENEEQEIDSCVGAFMMVRASSVRQVGLFDEDFFFYGEDLDWCWRFKEAGFKIMYTPRAKIIHYKGATSGIKSHSKHLSKATKESRKKAIIESTRAMELFYQKHLKNEYPAFVTFIIILAVKILEKYRLIKIQYLQ